MKITVIIPFLVISLIVHALASDESGELNGSILYTRIGYDLDSDKRIIIRSKSEGYIEGTTSFELFNEDGKVVFSGKVVPWGRKWNEFWWIADFSEFVNSGVYTCSVKITDGLKLETKPFKISSDLLWNDTWETVAIEQLEGRVELRKKNYTKHGPAHAEGGGWQDCGGYLREVNSHATMLNGLFDVLEFSGDRIDQDEKEEIMSQMIIGLDYIAFCQDKAAELGKGEGAIIHEWPKHTNVITGDVIKGALCFARAAKVFESANSEKAKEYLERAQKSFSFMDKNGPIHHSGGTDFHGTVQPDDGFNPVIHGAPKGFVRPVEWKTRDLVMMSWAALELSGEEPYKEKAIAYAKQVIDRQISKNEPEGDFYGHFKAYASAGHTEKAWEHHHMGYDAGATFPHYIIPIIQLTQKYPDHPDQKKWGQAIKDFAYGYFLPACSDNPFYLLPMGYYKDEGLLVFSGLWHGMNGAYGSAAALALELWNFTGDEKFKSIATGNLQWIAGLNSGIEEDGTYVSKSMIYGLGDEFIGSWTKIPGTICNGFESDRQFHVEAPKKSTDGPNVFTDEGWITHSGGWLSAISRLNKPPK
ncbi:MAG: glycoside hydrolase family 9 protein [Cytophagales bacterium]|nr:glycoside hydrolase family 9 protein [Cytophagales bacterium]